MIYSGTRPAQHLSKVKPFKHSFGALAATVIDDFNVDKGLWMPDQIADGSLYGCVGYTSADYFTDLAGRLFSPDFSVAAAKYIAGDPPSSLGTSFHAGVDARVGMGGLVALMNGGISTHTHTEASAEDWTIWQNSQKQAAHQYNQNGVRNVLGNGDAFDSIILACYQTRKGITIGSPWMFKDINDDYAGAWVNYSSVGVCPTPDTTKNYLFFPWHSYAIKGKKTINGKPYAIVKWWGGQKGDHGFLYFNRETVNFLMGIPQAGALTVDDNADRFISLIGIIIRRFPNVSPFTTQLLKAHP